MFNDLLKKTLISSHRLEIQIWKLWNTKRRQPFDSSPRFRILDSANNPSWFQNSQRSIFTDCRRAILLDPARKRAQLARGQIIISSRRAQPVPGPDVMRGSKELSVTKHLNSYPTLTICCSCHLHLKWIRPPLEGRVGACICSSRIMGSHWPRNAPSSSVGKTPTRLNARLTIKQKLQFSLWFSPFF